MLSCFFVYHICLHIFLCQNLPMTSPGVSDFDSRCFTMPGRAPSRNTPRRFRWMPSQGGQDNLQLPWYVFCEVFPDGSTYSGQYMKKGTATTWRSYTPTQWLLEKIALQVSPSGESIAMHGDGHLQSGPETFEVRGTWKTSAAHFNVVEHFKRLLLLPWEATLEAFCRAHLTTECTRHAAVLNQLPHEKHGVCSQSI